MAIEVPVDVDVTGLSTLEALDETLDEVSENRRAKVDVDTSSAQAAATSLSSSLADAGMNVDELRKSLEFGKERAEAKRLEDALDAVAKLRQAGVDVDVDGLSELAELDKALAAVEKRRRAASRAAATEIKEAAKAAATAAKAEKVTIPVEIDTDKSIRDAVRGGGAIQEAFSGAFQLVAKNAILLVAAIGIAFAALPVIGAVAGTGLVLGFGGAIAGIGILAAAQSKEVQTAFQDMAKEVVGDVKEMAIPFESTLKSIAEFAGRTWQTFAPELSDAFADMAPVITIFANNFLRAFERLAPAISPLTDAFDALLTEMGPRLDGFFKRLSDSLIGLSSAISADPELFSDLFVGLLEILPALVNGITGLANIFRFVVDTVRNQLGPALDELSTALEPISKAFSDATGGASLMRFVIGTMAGTFTVFVGAIAGAIRAIALMIGGIIDLVGAVRRTWNNTLTVTRSAWAAVRAVVATAIGRIRGAVTSGMTAISGSVSRALARIRGFFSSAWATIRGVVSGGIAAVRSAVAGGMARVVSAVSGAWSSARGATSRGVSNVVGVVRSLPGRILGALGGLAGSLYSSGYRMISSLADGIRAAFGNAIAAARDGLSTLRSYFPFSPAKRGPFSGSGYTTHSGEALVRDFAGAISSTAKSVAPSVGASLAPMADAFVAPDIRPRTASTGAATGAGATTVTGAPGDLVAALVAALGNLQIIVTPGMDRRATAELWLNGQKYAEALA